MMLLRIGVFAAFALALALLTLQARRTMAFGRRPLHSEPQGDPRKGVAYAFGRGMLPWEKESAAKHLPTFLAGMIYHTGIFAAILFAFLLALSLRLPAIVRILFQAAMAAGFVAGAGLLIKRRLKMEMRFLSCPDDYLANLLVDIFILAGLAASWTTGAVPVFLAVSIAVFLYMPFGKIRHCVFFFFSRFLFGSYFGRRGVLPRRKPSGA